MRVFICYIGSFAVCVYIYNDFLSNLSLSVTIIVCLYVRHSVWWYLREHSLLWFVSVCVPPYMILTSLSCICCVSYVLAICLTVSSCDLVEYLTKSSMLDVWDSTVSSYDVVNNDASRFLLIWESYRYLWVCASVRTQLRKWN